MLQTNIQSHNAVRVIRTSALRMKIVRNRQARHSRPALSDLKQFQPVHESVDLCLAEPGLKHNRENARRSVLPQLEMENTFIRLR
jgi:hypothetical protein